MVCIIDMVFVYMFVHDVCVCVPKPGRRCRVHVCGEGGEYESFTLDCPLYHRLSTHAPHKACDITFCLRTLVYLVIYDSGKASREHLLLSWYPSWTATDPYSTGVPRS